VGVKVLEKSKIQDQGDVRRVNREIKILMRCGCFNVSEVFEVLDTQNAIYLIMEHIDGGELFDFIVKQKRLEERQACFLFHQILDGLEYLHSNNISHRDIKPENILLQSSPAGWIVKIIDFGLSNTFEDGQLLKTACGESLDLILDLN